MLGTFSPPPRVCDPGMHHGTCVTHVLWCMPGSLTSDFLWSWRRGEMFPAFPAHAQPKILRIWQEAHHQLSRFKPIRYSSGLNSCVPFDFEVGGHIHVGVYYVIIYLDNGLSLLGTKACFKSVLTYRWLNPGKQMSSTFDSSLNNFNPKIYLKWSPANCRPFCSGCNVLNYDTARSVSADINSSALVQNGRHFADDISDAFLCIKHVFYFD